MAKRLEFKPAPKALNQSEGARERNEQRLREAPLQHSDALLSLYQLLQQMHDSGTLDLLRGGLFAGGKLAEEVSAALVQPETIRGLRNLILLGKSMAGIDPDMLERVVKSLPQPQEQKQMTDDKPPSVLGLLRRMFSSDSRRGLGIALGAAAALGQATRPQPKE
ncbi:MAG TPA: DUF1641 domain-containing protein [Acidisarcina sp.]